MVPNIVFKKDFFGSNTKESKFKHRYLTFSQRKTHAGVESKGFQRLKCSGQLKISITKSFNYKLTNMQHCTSDDQRCSLIICYQKKKLLYEII